MNKKQKPQKPKSGGVFVTTQITKELNEQLVEVANRDLRTRSWILRQLIIKFLESKGKSTADLI